MTPRVGPVARVGARMILFDDADRVLLIEETFDGDGRTDGGDGAGGRPWRHWLTPGGGVEAGESWPVAATRELVEETGMRVVLPVDAAEVHRHRRSWSWAGVDYDQVDHYFAARVAAPFDPRPAALTEMERETVLGARWWTVAEIRASADVFVPPDLGAVLGDLLTSEAGQWSRPTARRAGRVLVLDPAGYVLMIETRTGRGREPAHWVAPGGGIENGESSAAAARRELAEETGIRADLEADAVPILSERAVFTFGELLLDQTDEYFLHRVSERPPVAPVRLSPAERDSVVSYRWWHPREMAAETAPFWPAGLADFLAGLAGPGAPREPSGTGPQA